MMYYKSLKSPAGWGLKYSCVINSTLPWQPKGQHGVGKGGLQYIPIYAHTNQYFYSSFPHTVTLHI